MPQQNCAVILAAGDGKRMKWDRPKALSPVLFKPMLQWVLDAAHAAGLADVCVVTGYLHERVEDYLRQHDDRAVPVLQPERRGTGHAVMMAADFLCAHAKGGNVLILNGDAPFIDEAAILSALEEHVSSGNSVTVISAVLDDPTGYGRVVRDEDGGSLLAIVEQKDASPQVLAVEEVNSGAYWFKTDDLLDILPKIRNGNVQGEYYLTDAVELLIAEGKRAGASPAQSANAVRGANDCFQLHELNTIARDRILSAHMRGGVDIPCADGVLIGPDVRIGRDCTVLPGTILAGRCEIGDGCVVGPGTVLEECTVGAGCTLDSVRASHCSLAPGTKAGPFAVLRKEPGPDGPDAVKI